MRPCFIDTPCRWQTYLSGRACIPVDPHVQAQTIQLLGRCAARGLCSLSGAASWEHGTQRLAWSAEAQPDLAGGPQHSDQLALTLLQDAGGRRLEADCRQRWASSRRLARMLMPPPGQPALESAGSLHAYEGCWRASVPAFQERLLCPRRRHSIPLGSCVERSAFLSATASSGCRLELSTSLRALGRALTSRVQRSC